MQQPGKFGSPKRDKQEKLPKLTEGGAATFQSNRTESVGNRTQYKVHLGELDKEPQARDMKKYFDALFPQTTIASHKKNRNGRLTPLNRPDDLETPSGSRNQRRLNYTTNSMSDEQSFFQAINEEIMTLDQKIHKTKDFISKVTNRNVTGAGKTRIPNQQNLSFDEGQPSDSRKYQRQQRQESPGVKMLNAIPKSNRSNSIDSAKQYLESTQKQTPKPTDSGAAKRDIDNNYKGNEGYGIGRTTGEDSEPERPTYEKPKLNLNQKGNSRGSDNHDSPLFDIATDIENRKANKPDTNDKNNSILAKYDTNTVKEEPHEENKDTDTHRLATGSNSKYSFQNQKLERSEEDRKSMDKKIAEVRESLNSYKKQLNKSRDLNSKTPESSNSNEPGNSKTNINKPKSDVSVGSKKPQEESQKL